MKLILYPFVNRVFSKLHPSFHLFLLLLSFSACFSVSAKTVVIGTGSGSVSQTSMTGLNAGDVLAIAPGTYTGGATFSNLNGITVTTNGGTVTFTGSNYVEIGSGNTNLTFIGLNFSSVASDAFLLTGTNVQGLYIYHCTFSGVTNNIIDAGGYCASYTGTVSTLKVSRFAMDNCKFTNCGQVWQGFYGTPSQNIGLCDSVEMGYDTVVQTATNGTEVAGPISHINFHHWQISYTGANPVTGDVGVFQTAGDGQIHDCYYKGGRGYLCRQLLYGLNATGAFYFYNNIIYGQNAYGGIDVRCDSSNYGSTNPYLTKANAWLYNCTMGNKTDINGYVCPVAIVGIMGANGGNATCQIRNMFAFNNQYGANSIANNNANGTWTVDTANDVYSDAAHALLYLQDTTTTFMPLANSYLNTNGVAMSTPYPAKPDLWGFAGTTNRIGAIFYNSGGHSVNANAGSNQTITLPTNSVSLSGSASTVVNSTISSYAWSETSGPNTATLSAANAVSTNATGLIAGTYVFSLKVTDANGDVSTATVTITVNPANQPPVVSAGTNQTISLPTSSVTLTGTATDLSGISSYLWTQSSGPNTATIVASNAASTSVTGLIAGTYVFQLKVVDVLNLSAVASVTITVNPANQPPVVSAGSNQTITLPTSTVTLTGTATDASGTISSYLWTQVSGPNTSSITNATSVTTTVTGLIAGTYVFQLQATDNNNLSGTGTVTITVNPTASEPPVVSAGTSQTITLPVSTATVTGTATDASGTITSYLWTQISGPGTATIATATAIKTNITGLIAGTYVFQLKATNNSNLSGTGTVTITVNPAPNQPPVVSAGSNQTVTLPANSVTLTGSATDATGTITSYSWTQVSGPNTSSITTATAITTTVSGLVAGTYVFQLKATDNNNLSGTGTVTITVNPAPNQPPVVSAGIAQTITLPVSTVILTGTATDATGTITSYLWTQVSGPNTSSITAATSITTSVTGLIAGTYVFQLKATDNNNLSGTGTVTITVNPAPNEPPVVNAGSNQTITLPTNSVTLSGVATDATGTITSYLWTQLSGPGSSTITNASSVTTSAGGLIAGTYVFQLKATDNNNLSGTSTVTITVNPAPNQPPVANAGASQTITLPVSSASLNGSQSSDPDGTIASYSWTEVSGPSAATISGANTDTPTVSSLLAGTYVFQLMVTDNYGLTGTAQVKVIVKPAAHQPPIANAGNNQTITLPVNSVTLDGSGSEDPDGTIVSFKWAQVSGPNQGTIASATSVTTNVNNLVQGTYVFSLTVTDNKGAKGTDSMTVIVNPAPHQPPVANAGASKTITLPLDSVSLNGSSSSDPDDTIVSYSWTQISGPSSATISGGNTATPTVSALIQGQYVFQLTVTDNSGASNSAQVNIIVNPAALINPTANAGANQTITLPLDSVSVDGGGSIAPSGTIVNFTWSQISGPSTAIIVSPHSVITQIDDLVQGVYVFGLTVTDNHGNTGSGTITITVNAAVHVPPVANAGTSATIMLPLGSVSLNGTKSSDPDGTIVSYSWVETSGPSTAIITNANTATPTISGLLAGKYYFQLTVTDNYGASDTSTVKITVIAAPVQPPVANAGANQTITLPLDSVTVNGSASQDASGTIVSYNWAEVSGPAQGTIVSPSSVSTSIKNLVQGVYIFQLTVTDNNGSTSSDTLTITVNAAPHQPPVANAGAPQIITLPVDSVLLNGTSSSDPDGTITSYSWSQVSGPSTATITGGATAKPTMSGLIAGTYVFQLTVTDNDGATSNAQVNITVLAAADQPPVANAGADQTITLPTSTVNLDGSASYDPDGTIASYSWTKTSGTGAVTITNSSTAKPTVTGLQQGKYVFNLTVADNRGATASAQVTVTVNPAAVVNQPPVANAGKDTTISLPASSVILNASASTAPSGNITTYQWVQVSGPNTAVIEAQDSAVTNASGLITGSYVFQITVTDNHGATATDTVTVTVLNTLRTSSSSTISIYPNPTTSTLNVQITSPATGVLWVYIYDVRGNVAMAKEYSKPSDYFSTPINLSLLYGGTYTLQAVIGKKTVMIAKFVKQ